MAASVIIDSIITTGEPLFPTMQLVHKFLVRLTRTDWGLLVNTLEDLIFTALPLIISIKRTVQMAGVCTLGRLGNI